MSSQTSLDPLPRFAIAMRPSDTWKTAEELVDDHRTSHAHWLRMPFEAIERMASACKDDVPCRANREKYAAGLFNIAVEVVFDDGTCWIARLSTCHYAPRAISQAEITQRIRCEVATLRLVAERTTIPVPHVFAFCETSANEIGWPYVLMSTLEGHKPEDVGIVHTYDAPQAITPEKQPLYDTFCRSLADVYVQLAAVQFPQIGSIYLDGNGGYVVGEEVETYIPPCSSSAEAYCQLWEYMFRQAHVDEHPERLFGLWLVRLLFASIVPSTGPFSLTHQDLNTGNILVDKSGRITGILDWDTAACHPRETFVAQAVEFIARTSADAEQKSWAQTFNRALATVDPQLATLQDTTLVKVLSSLVAFNLGQPELYAPPWFREEMCRVLFGTSDWESVQESPVFKEWREGILARKG